MIFKKNEKRTFHLVINERLLFCGFVEYTDAHYGNYDFALEVLLQKIFR